MKINFLHWFIQRQTLPDDSAQLSGFKGTRVALLARCQSRIAAAAQATVQLSGLGSSLPEEELHPGPTQRLSWLVASIARNAVGAMEPASSARRPWPHGAVEEYAFPVFASKRRKKDFSDEDDPDCIKQPALHPTGLATAGESQIPPSALSVAESRQYGADASAPPEQPRAAAGGSADPSPAEMRCPVLGCGAALWGVAEYDRHYRSCHQLACHVCRKSLPSARLLSLHVSEAHDSFFQAKLARGVAMYECLVETCDQRFHADASRLRHLVDRHGFPRSFRFHGAAASHPSQKQRRKQQQLLHSNRAQDLKHGKSHREEETTTSTSLALDNVALDTGALHPEEDCIRLSTSVPLGEPPCEHAQSAMRVEEPGLHAAVEPGLCSSAEEGRPEYMRVDTSAAPLEAAPDLLDCGPAAAIPANSQSMDVELQLSAALSRLSCTTDFVPRQVSFGRRSSRGTMPPRAGAGSKGQGPPVPLLAKPGLA